jgi:hypothetical protein
MFAKALMAISQLLSVLIPSFFDQAIVFFAILLV